MNKKKNEFGFNFSYSSVSTYKQCPLRFKLHYIDKEPILQNDAMQKGNEVHKMAEELIIDINKNKIITKDLSQYKHKDELQNFLKLEDKRYNKHTIKADYFDSVTEEKIRNIDINTIGMIDRVYKLWDNQGYVLLDYKSGKVRDKSYYYPQLCLYVYLHNQKHPEKKLSFWEIDWLTEESKYFIEKIDYDLVDKYVAEYLKTIEDIENTDTYKHKLTPLCMWCGVLHVCPYQKEALSRFKGIADKKGLDIVTIIRKGLRNRAKVLANKNSMLSQQIKLTNTKPNNLFFYSKIVGTTFVKFDYSLLKVNDTLILEREPNNEFDKNAIAVYFKKSKLGYIRKSIAKDLSHTLDIGKNIKCTIENLTGGAKDKENKGINIKLEMIK